MELFSVLMMNTVIKVITLTIYQFGLAYCAQMSKDSITLYLRRKVANLDLAVSKSKSTMACKAQGPSSNRYEMRRRESV